MDRIDQRISESSSGIQAARDVNINVGVTVQEVKDLCYLFLKDNFPKLRQDAVEAAKRNVDAYLSQLDSTIHQNAERIDPSVLGNPGFQYILDKSVQDSAKRGPQANCDLLAQLVIDRAAKRNPDLLNLVVEEAIGIVPKLTRSHIAFLSFVHFMQNVGMPQASSILQLEALATKVLASCRPGFGLSESNRLYLEFTGCMTFLSFASHDIFTVLSSNYPGIAKTCEKPMQENVNLNTNSLKLLAKEYQDASCGGITLTSVGQVVALVYLKPVLGRLDYSIWIK